MANDVPREYNQGYTYKRKACVKSAQWCAYNFNMDRIVVSNKEFDRIVHRHLPKQKIKAKESLYILKNLSKLNYGQKGVPRNIKRQLYDEVYHSLHILDSSFYKYYGNVDKAIKRYMFNVSISFHEVIFGLVWPLLIFGIIQQPNKKGIFLQSEKFYKEKAQQKMNSTRVNSEVQHIEDGNLKYLTKWKGKNFKSQRDFKENIEVFNITVCIVLNKIEIFNKQVVKSDICTPDLLVKFEVQNKTNVGFLTDKNIIRAVPTVSKKCINPLFRYFHMNNILIKRENNKVMKMNNVKTMEIRDIEKRDGSISFPHYKRILEQIDVLSEIKNSHYEDIQDLKEKLLFKDKSEEKNLVIDELTKIKDSTFTIIGEYRSKIMIYLVSIILIIIITFIFIVFCSQRMSIMNWIQKRKIRRELVRLDPLTQEYLRLTKFRNEEL